MDVALVLVLVTLVVVVAVSAVVLVPRDHAAVISRLGRYHRTVPSGVHVAVPFVDRMQRRVDLRVQRVAWNDVPMSTADGQSVLVDGTLEVQVVNPRVAAEISDPVRASELLGALVLRNIITEMDREQALVSRGTLSRQLHEALDEGGARWGVRVRAVELTAIRPAPQS